MSCASWAFVAARVLLLAYVGALLAWWAVHGEGHVAMKDRIEAIVLTAVGCAIAFSLLFDIAYGGKAWAG